jgi:hypothetical protein
VLGVLAAAGDDVQAVIALYALVMAGLMLTGGKLGDMWIGAWRPQPSIST